MLRKIELWCLITLISIVYGLNFKCKHLENSTIYQNSEEFCKDRDIKKVPNSVADKSSLNLVCTLTAHLIDDKSCLSIKEAVIENEDKTIEDLCQHLMSIINTTSGLSSNFSGFLNVLNKTNLCTKTCVDYESNIRPICKLLLITLKTRHDQHIKTAKNRTSIELVTVANVSAVNISKPRNNTVPPANTVPVKKPVKTNDHDDGGFAFDHAKDSILVQNPHNGHDVLNKQLNHEKLMEHEQSGFMIFFFIVTLVCLCGFLIYLNKQKIMGCVIEGRNSNVNRGRRYNYRRLNTNLEDAISSKDHLTENDTTGIAF